MAVYIRVNVYGSTVQDLDCWHILIYWRYSRSTLFKGWLETSSLSIMDEYMLPNTPLHVSCKTLHASTLETLTGKVSHATHVWSRVTWLFSAMNKWDDVFFCVFSSSTSVAYSQRGRQAASNVLFEELSSNEGGFLWHIGVSHKNNHPKQPFFQGSYLFQKNCIYKTHVTLKFFFFSQKL